MLRLSPKCAPPRPAPFLLERGLKLLPNFQKRVGGGGLTAPHFERWVAGKERGNFFQVRLQFLQKKKKQQQLKSQIFNGKKIDKKNIFLCHN